MASLLDAILQSLTTPNTKPNSYNQMADYQNNPVKPPQQLSSPTSPYLPGLAQAITGGVSEGQIPSSIPGAPQIPQTTETGFTTTPEKKQMSPTMQALMRIAPTLGAALVGSMNPDALPAASGFATGYEDAQQKQSEDKKTGKIKIFDEETGDIIDSDQIYEATDKILTKSTSKEDFRDQLLKELLGLDKSATVKTGEGVKMAEDKVRVINAQGQPGTIPKAQLDEARKQGYTVAQ